jgi:hypothetical protein
LAEDVVRRCLLSDSDISRVRRQTGQRATVGLQSGRTSATKPFNLPDLPSSAQGDAAEMVTAVKLVVRYPNKFRGWANRGEPTTYSQLWQLH